MQTLFRLFDSYNANARGYQIVHYESARPTSKRRRFRLRGKNKGNK